MRRPARIGVTRAADRAETLVVALQGLGAEPVPMPALEHAFTDPGPLDSALAATHDGVAFVSARSVEACAARVDLRSATRGLCVAAVGRATGRALEEHGVVVDLVPRVFRAEALLGALRGRFGATLRGMRWLVPRAEGGRRTLEEGLQADGAYVNAVAAYRTLPASPSAIRAALVTGVDLVTFASGSAVEAFAAALGTLPAPGCVTIGPVTTDACRAAGLRVLGEAEEAGLVSLARAAVACAAPDRP